LETPLPAAANSKHLRASGRCRAAGFTLAVYGSRDSRYLVSGEYRWTEMSYDVGGNELQELFDRDVPDRLINPSS